MDELDVDSDEAEDEVFDTILEEDQEVAQLQKGSALGMSRDIELKLQHLKQKRQDDPGTYWRKQRQIRQALARAYPEKFRLLPKELQDKILPPPRPLPPRSFNKLFPKCPEWSLWGHFNSVEEYEAWKRGDETGDLQSDMLDRATRIQESRAEAEAEEQEEAEASTKPRRSARTAAKKPAKKLAKTVMSAKAKGKLPAERSVKDIPSPATAMSPPKKRSKRMR